MLFPKTLYLIKKSHILLTLFGTENGRPYLVDSNEGYPGVENLFSLF